MIMLTPLNSLVSLPRSEAGKIPFSLLTPLQGRLSYRVPVPPPYYRHEHPHDPQD